jgi:hypothetical protein
MSGNGPLFIACPLIILNAPGDLFNDSHRGGICSNAMTSTHAITRWEGGKVFCYPRHSRDPITSTHLSQFHHLCQQKEKNVEGNNHVPSAIHARAMTAALYFHNDYTRAVILLQEAMARQCNLTPTLSPILYSCRIIAMSTCTINNQVYVHVQAKH